MQLRLHCCDLLAQSNLSPLDKDPPNLVDKHTTSLALWSHRLCHFQPDDPVILETNASDYAIGAVISQCDSAGSTRPIAFTSRRLSPAELNYPVHDKEFLAIFWAFQMWRHYLEGPKESVLVLTDHHSLQHFMTTKQLTRRQARWAEFMGEFNLHIQYRPGKSATKPDALSRRPDYKPADHNSTSLSAELNPQNLRAMIDTNPVRVLAITTSRMPTPAEDCYSSTVTLTEMEGSPTVETLYPLFSALWLNPSHPTTRYPTQPQHPLLDCPSPAIVLTNPQV
nr:hypothetical protein L203_00527 [Cryptococcus depauperatus CBS 7841]